MVSVNTNGSDGFQVGEQGLEAVARNCPSLEVLMLVEVGNTTDQVILVIAHYLKRIKTLDVQVKHLPLLNVRLISHQSVGVLLVSHVYGILSS